MIEKKVSLENLLNGAIFDLFDEEWEKVIENINDQNVKTDEERNITIKISVKPSKKGYGPASVTMSAKTKLASGDGFGGSVIFDKDDEGKLTAFSFDPNQPLLPAVEDADKDNKVLKMRRNDNG